MPRSVSHIYRVTWECDWCGKKEISEADGFQMERTELYKESLPKPDGWILASSDRLERRSASIPDIYFDSMEHFDLWKERRIKEVGSQITIPYI